jgi:hypothetical protein
MPFTPIHMGPGMAVKAAVPRHFSIIVFGLTQIALDLEVLWYLVGRHSPLHRFWHTYLGATVVALVFGVLGKPVSQFIKWIWNHIARWRHDVDLSVPVHTSWPASALAAVVGAYSHILLDSLFHWDIEPLRPWSTANPFLGVIAPMMLEIGCVFLGVIGLVWFFDREIKARKAGKKTSCDRQA